MTTYNEIILSLDIEADGRVPGISSMLSFGLAAFDINKNFLGTFERNLDLLPNSKPHPDTQEFWDDNKEAYRISRLNTVNPYNAMLDCNKWINQIKSTFGKVVTVAGYPATFDYMWFNWYMYAFLNQNQMGFGAFDAKSYSAAVQRQTFRTTTKRNMPRQWFDDFPHTHVALDDAISQGAMIINMIRDNHNLPHITGVIKSPKFIKG